MDHGVTAAPAVVTADGRANYFANLEQRFRRDFPAISVHGVPPTIAAFINDLFTDASVTKPVDDIYIGTHASGDGFLFVRLFPDQVDALGDPTGYTDYEVLDQAIQASARPARIPDSLVGYQHATPPAPDPPPTHSVHIKGCNIGKDRFLPRPGQPVAPFLVRLKQAFGDNVQVTAPKHFHGLLPETNHNGIFEYMEQELIVRTKAVKMGNRFRGFANRNELIEAYKAAHLSYHDGTPIPDADWNTLVPRRMVDARGIHMTLPLGRTIENLTAVTVNKELRIEPEQVTWEMPGDAAIPAAQRFTRLRESIAGNARFLATHPWPMYERRGFVDFNSYMDGHLWSPSVVGPNVVWTGRRVDYTILLPIVDRSVASPASRPLIFNFYPGVGSPEAPILTGFVESDNRFFGRA